MDRPAEAQIGRYFLTKPASSSVRCRAYDAPPSLGGTKMCTIQPNTTIGPIEAVEDTYQFRAVLVRGFWINVWSASSGKLIKHVIQDEVVRRWVQHGWEHRFEVLQ